MEVLIVSVFYCMMYTLVIFLGGVFYGLHVHKLEDKEEKEDSEK